MAHPIKKPKREVLMAPNGSGLASTYVTGVLFGPNGCGKTTFAEQLAHYYARGTRVTGKAWAIDPNGAWSDSEGVKSLWPQDGAEGIDQLLTDSATWGPGLMIFDDADAYIRHSTQIQTNYMTRNRHLRKDQLVIARRPQGIPKDAIASAKFVCLYAGSLTEVYAHTYLKAIYGKEILSRVPTKEFYYLLIMRKGGAFHCEVRKTVPRSVKTVSDKT